MRRIMSLLIGFGLGGVIGAALLRLLPGNQTVRARLQAGWQESLAAARAASAQRRAELEAELAQKMKPTKSGR
jgi:gas vesicle protein